MLVESEDEAKEAFVRYRPRLRDTGYLWMITRKRGHEKYLNQMALVPFAKRLGLIDNKTCSIDDERSGIRFVIPRALRRDGKSRLARHGRGVRARYEDERVERRALHPVVGRVVVPAVRVEEQGLAGVSQQELERLALEHDVPQLAVVVLVHRPGNRAGAPDL